MLVLDIDDRILTTVRSEAANLGLSERVRVERADLSSPQDCSIILDHYSESFDLVVTDHPYAQDGVTQFVSVAMALTAHTGEIHVAVPALLAEAWTDELLHGIQYLLVNHGLILDRVTPGMFTYLTSDVVSALLIARRLPGGQVLSEIPRAVADRFYTTRFPPPRVPLIGTKEEMENS